MLGCTMVYYFLLLFNMKTITCILRRPNLVRWDCFSVGSNNFYQLLCYWYLMKVCLTYFTIIPKPYFSTFFPLWTYLQDTLIVSFRRGGSPGSDFSSLECEKFPQVILMYPFRRMLPNSMSGQDVCSPVFSLSSESLL